ncbi:MAG: hypothetical protein ACK5FV_16660, partial [Bacteroidota bacterium]
RGIRADIPCAAAAALEAYFEPDTENRTLIKRGTGGLEQDTTGNPGVKKTKIVYPKLSGAYPEIKKP